jgi:hypothetical protein
MADMTPEQAMYLHTLQLGKTPTPAQTEAFNKATEAAENAAPAVPAKLVVDRDNNVHSVPLLGDSQDVAELMGPEDDDEHPDRFLGGCEREGCKALANGGTLFFSGRRPVSMDKLGRVHFGEYVPVIEERVMTSVIGPSAVQGVSPAYMIKRELKLCQEHYRLDPPRMPIKPRKVRTSGPYSAFGAERRAHEVERVTGDRVRIFQRRLANGKIGHFVNGDDPAIPGWRGEMTPGE